MVASVEGPIQISKVVMVEHRGRDSLTEESRPKS